MANPIPYHPIALSQYLPADYDPDIHGFDAALSEDTSWSISEFLRGGKNIFHLEKELLGLFEKTDVSNLVLKDINLPYDSCYIYFAEARLETPDYDYENQQYLHHKNGDAAGQGIPVEGAYVNWFHSIAGLTLEIELVTSLNDGNGILSYAMSFHDTETGSLIRQLESTIHNNPFQDINELADRRWLRRVDNDKLQYKKLKEDWTPDAKNIAWETVAKKALSLIFNALIYLSSNDSDTEDSYPDYCPQKLVRKTKSDNKKEADRAISKLDNMGYRTVKFLGRRLKRSFTHQITDKNVLTHWRRGHWRRQPYGKKTKALAKLVWIKPTIINKSEESLIDIAGRVYMVDIKKAPTQ